MATDHGVLRSCVDGRKGDSIATVDHEEASRDRRSTDRKDCRARTRAKDNYSRSGRNWTHGIRKWTRGNTRRIAWRKAGWFETTLARARNRALAQGHNPRTYEQRG